MSECPGCHTGARHVGVVVGWRPTDPWFILHECRKTPACPGQWTEEVLFPGPVLERVRASADAYRDRKGTAVTLKPGVVDCAEGHTITEMEAGRCAAYNAAKGLYGNLEVAPDV